MPLAVASGQLSARGAAPDAQLLTRVIYIMLLPIGLHMRTHQAAALCVQDHGAGADTQADAAAAGSALGSDAAGATEPPDAEGADSGEKADEQAPALDGDASLGGLKLLAATAAYQRCLPGAMADARIDIGRFVPAVRNLTLQPNIRSTTESWQPAARARCRNP